MKIEIRETETFEKVTPGSVSADVIGFEESSKHPQYGEAVIVTFSVTDANGVKETVKAYWKPICSPKSNLGMLCTAAAVKPKNSWGTVAFAKALIGKTVTMIAYRNPGDWTRVNFTGKGSF